MFKRTVKHQHAGFTSENATEKLRIQMFQLVSGASYLLSKKDLPLSSIVSREQFIITSHQTRRDQELPPDLSLYSSFSHGNNLNAMMGMSSDFGAKGSNLISSASSIKSRNLDSGGGKKIHSK